jgi:hypothetical protein
MHYCCFFFLVLQDEFMEGFLRRAGEILMEGMRAD